MASNSDDEPAGLDEGNESAFPGADLDTVDFDWEADKPTGGRQKAKLKEKKQKLKPGSFGGPLLSFAFSIA